MLLLTTTQCVQGQTLSRCLGNDFIAFFLFCPTSLIQPQRFRHFNFQMSQP